MGGASCVPDNKWGSSNGHHLASDKYNRVCDGVVNGDLGWVSTSSGFRFCNRESYIERQHQKRF